MLAGCRPAERGGVGGHAQADRADGAGVVHAAGDMPGREVAAGTAGALPGRGAGVQGVAMVARRAACWRQVQPTCWGQIHDVPFSPRVSNLFKKPLPRRILFQGVSRISCQFLAVTARLTMRFKRARSVMVASSVLTDSSGSPNFPSPKSRMASRVAFSWPSSRIAR